MSNEPYVSYHTPTFLQYLKDDPLKTIVHCVFLIPMIAWAVGVIVSIGLTAYVMVCIIVESMG